MSVDTEVLKHLPDEAKARLVEFEKTFNSKGFQMLIQWAKATAEEKAQRMLFAQNWDQYLFLKGEWSMFTELANIEDTTYREFENMAAEAKENAVVESELEYE